MPIRAMPLDCNLGGRKAHGVIVSEDLGAQAVESSLGAEF